MMGEQSRGESEPPYWRQSSPATLSLALGIGHILSSVLLALWSLTLLGTAEGRARGVAAIAVFVAWTVAALFAVYGGVLSWIGWKGRRTGWLRGPAIASGVGFGTALTLAVILTTALWRTPVLLSPLGLVPGAVGAVLGWRWSVVIRRRQDESAPGLSFERPGVAGLVGGGIGVVIGAVVMLFTDPIGSAIVGVSMAGMVTVPAYYWVLRPAYRWVRSR